MEFLVKLTPHLPDTLTEKELTNLFKRERTPGHRLSGSQQDDAHVAVTALMQHPLEAAHRGAKVNGYVSSALKASPYIPVRIK